MSKNINIPWTTYDTPGNLVRASFIVSGDVGAAPRPNVFTDDKLQFNAKGSFAIRTTTGGGKAITVVYNYYEIGNANSILSF